MNLSLLTAILPGRRAWTIFSWPFFFLLLTVLPPKISHAAAITDVLDFVKLFENAGFKKPTIVINETETTFDLSIQGGVVDHSWSSDTGTFTEDFVFNFWRGNVTFSQMDGLFSFPDTVTAALTIFHQAGIDRPHHGDLLKGNIFTFHATTLKQGDRMVDFGGVVSHPASHSDVYKGQFSVAGKDNKIGGWTFTAKGAHVPEPSSIICLATLSLPLIRSVRRRGRVGVSSMPLSDLNPSA